MRSGGMELKSPGGSQNSALMGHGGEEVEEGEREVGKYGVGAGGKY